MILREQVKHPAARWIVCVLVAVVVGLVPLVLVESTIARASERGGEPPRIPTIFDLTPFIVENDLPHHVFLGTEASNTIGGTPGPDIIFAFGGADRLSGGLGSDILIGGGGNDFMVGNNGSDLMLGETGNDYIDSSNGIDTIFGGGGDDRILGLSGFDIIDGGSGEDDINAGLGDDDVDGGRGDDFIWGRWGFDLLKGGPGDDNLIFNVPLTGNFEFALECFDPVGGFRERWRGPLPRLLVSPIRLRRNGSP